MPSPQERLTLNPATPGNSLPARGNPSPCTHPGVGGEHTHRAQGCSLQSFLGFALLQGAAESAAPKTTPVSLATICQQKLRCTYMVHHRNIRAGPLPGTLSHSCCPLAAPQARGGQRRAA